MKIALLHGAVKNAGDFLILERAKGVLSYVYPECKMDEYYRNTNLESKLDEINQNDILIFAGGPGYVNGFYPRMAPIVDDLNKIKIPIMMLGMGWWGGNAEVNTLYRYNFDEKMRELLQRAKNDTKCLGCRDWYTVDVLRNNGIEGAVMTGCPAWYDLEHVPITTYQGKALGAVEKICISDCGNGTNWGLAMDLAVFVKKFFGEKEIYFVCHRGAPDPAMGVQIFLEELGVKLINIADSVEGFQIYDDCDLHIGFRVHAHIYNLSKRKLSILVEEDSRGAGVNAALGLPHICSYIPVIKDGKQMYALNDKMRYQVEDYLFDLAAGKYIQIENAFMLMNRYFGQMISHVSSIEKFI